MTKIKRIKLDLWGNAIDLLNAAEGAGWEVHRMPTDANPKAGAIFVMAVASHPYGHTGVVIEDSDGYTMKTIEQNIDGNWNALEVGGSGKRNYMAIGQTDEAGNRISLWGTVE
ncbi:cell wall hydrolase, lysin - phage associated [Streptococcus hyointestinalis]|uniref:Cell wall hydrolase, lysin - phage associated n=1 Tax=Streptococcus hyointestinalis TaxID=1337 RepID=A0A380K7I7_9STRE|nr:cell wall hydrolase, lysin - phage associated [Streptococcus hyointestinalis]